MASIVTTRTLLDGSRNTQIKVDITGVLTDELNKVVIFDPANFTNKGVDKKLADINYELNGFTGLLYWDGTVDEKVISLADGHESFMDYESYVGGLSNTHIAGRTGKLLLSTNGLAALDHGYIIFTIKSK